MQTMDDGVPIAFTRYTPDGAAPAGGRPGVLVLHGLAGNRGSVDVIASTFANAGYSVLAYDARGHGTSGGEITLAGPREVADLRALRNAFAARPEVSDTIGALGDLLRRRPDLERARRRRAARGRRGRRDLDVALRRALVAGSRPLRDRRRLRRVDRRPLAPRRGHPRRRRPEPQPRRRPHARAAALRGRPDRLDHDARLPLPGPGRLRVRHHPGGAGLREPPRAEEALRRQLRAHAVDLPRRGRAVRARAGGRLVRPPPEADGERCRRGEGRAREAGLGAPAASRSAPCRSRR